MGRMVIVPWELQVTVPCHTYGCSGVIRWKVVSDELVNVAPAIVAGLCDDCKDSLARGALEKPVQATIGWAEVDRFLRDNREDPMAVPIVEGAMGRFLMQAATTPPVVKRRGRPVKR